MNKMIADTLVLFATARVQLEASKALLEQTRATLLKLGGCDDEITRLNRMIRDTDTVLARTVAKLKYVSKLGSKS